MTRWRTAATTAMVATAATRLATAGDVAGDDPVRFADVVDLEADVECLGEGMGFTDIPNNVLKKWSAAGGIETFREPSQRANGNTVDAAGRLISCEQDPRRLSIAKPGEPPSVLVDTCEGKKFNSPNDVAVRADGTIWFTDPPYGLAKRPKEMEGNFVFRFDPKTATTTIVARDFAMPNGICFSPDGRTLYVADSGKPRHIRAFDVADGGALSGGRVFATIDKGVPDGIKCDRDGRLYSSAGDGVHVFAPDGARMGRILVPLAPANLGFGGKDGRTLFITARGSVYRIELKVKG